MDTYGGKMAIFGILFSLFCTFCSWSQLFAIIKTFFHHSFICLFNMGFGQFDQSKLKEKLMDSYGGKISIFGILFSLFCTFCSTSELFAIIKKNFFPSFIQLFFFYKKKATYGHSFFYVRWILGLTRAN